MKDKFIKRLSLNKKSKANMKSILFAINHYSSFLSNKPLENSTEDNLLHYILHYGLPRKGKTAVAVLMALLARSKGSMIYSNVNIHDGIRK